MNAGYPGTDDILKYDPVSSAYLGEFAQVGAFTQSGDLTMLTDITVGPTGDVFAGTFHYGAIRRYDGTSGQYLGDFNKGITIVAPISEIFGPDGNLYVASLSFGAIMPLQRNHGGFYGIFRQLGRPGYSVLPHIWARRKLIR